MPSPYDNCLTIRPYLLGIIPIKKAFPKTLINISHLGLHIEFKLEY